MRFAYLKLIKTSIILALFSTSAQAAPEPSYCEPTHFISQQIKIPFPLSWGLSRAHVFKLGQVTFAGLAVGSSFPSAVIGLSHLFSDKSSSIDGTSTADPISPAPGYCTWYLHHSSRKAKKLFNWNPILKHPKQMSTEEAFFTFESALADQFTPTQSPYSHDFLNCLENSKYLAIGCQGMKHRGPSAFAMILAFSGCTPEHSVDIANRLWGLNGVPYDVRLAVAQSGFELGGILASERKRFQTLFGNPPVEASLVSSETQ